MTSGTTLWIMRRHPYSYLETWKHPVKSTSSTDYGFDYTIVVVEPPAVTLEDILERLPPDLAWRLRETIYWWEVREYLRALRKALEEKVKKDKEAEK